MAGKVRCTICNNVGFKRFVDQAIADGFSNKAIAAWVLEMGSKLDEEIIGRHKNRHYMPKVDPAAPKPTAGDLAKLVEEKAYDAIADLSPEALLVFGKEATPVINAGLKAQAIREKREVTNRKLGIAEGELTLQALIAGFGREVAGQLEDGTTVEGEYKDVTPSE